MPNIELTDDELHVAITTVALQEAVNLLGKPDNVEDTAEDRVRMAELHQLGHRLAEASGADYHNEVMSATRELLKEVIMERLRGGL